MMRRIADGRATYGYRRITVLLNRELQVQYRAQVNHKRVYRLMAHNGLLLAPHTGRGRQLTHDGKVITLRPTMRWCSDAFELPCWSGEAVRVAFVLDPCDREIISHIGTTAGVCGEMIRDLMVESVEARFGTDRVPHPLGWLSDNGSCYTAHETIDHAHALGLIPCFTPVKSPASNGMAAAFVKTFKRDYVYVHDRPDAASVLAPLHGWFEDYHKVHPHKGLKMRSPREFIRSQSLNSMCPAN